MHSFETVVDKLWNSAIASYHRERDKRTGALRFPPARITKPEFRGWLRAASEGGRGVLWRCEYTGTVIYPFSEVPATRMTIDHRVALRRGGISTVENLAIVASDMNRIKGDMSYECFKALLKLMENWPPLDRGSVLKRLKDYRPNFAGRPKKKAAGFTQEDVLAGIGRDW